MTYKVTLNGKCYEVAVEKGEAIMVDIADAQAAPAPPSAPAAAPAAQAPPPPPAGQSLAAGEAVKAPLPGVVLAVRVSAGQSVKKGDILCVIEAMKMENEVLAPRDGTVAQVVATKGGAVDTGAPLIVLS